MENLWFIRDTVSETDPKVSIRTFYELNNSDDRISYDTLKNIVFVKICDTVPIRELKIPKSLFSLCEETFNELGRMHYNELKKK